MFTRCSVTLGPVAPLGTDRTEFANSAPGVRLCDTRVLNEKSKRMLIWGDF